MTIECPNCRSDDFQFVQPYRNHSSFLEGSYIARCVVCDINFITPAPEATEWQSYNENYFERAHDGLNLDHASIAFHQAMAKIRVEHVIKNLDPPKPSPTVLEIGPGIGYFAKQWKEQFPESSYFVLESDKNLHAHLLERGIMVLDKGIEQLEAGSVDICIMSHVLEHVIYPSDVLREVTAPLKKGGLLFIEVPCLDFIYKDIHEPHMLFFSKEALRGCARRAGFSNTKLTYHGDKISVIRRYAFLRRVMVKLSRLTKLPLTIGFGPADNIIKQYDFTVEQALAVAQTQPFVTNQEPSRWLRMIARK